jgi:hypothetical protein
LLPQPPVLVLLAPVRQWRLCLLDARCHAAGWLCVHCRRQGGLHEVIST